MSTIATVTGKTYKANLQDSGTILVSGLEANTITSETPDTVARLERRNALRSEIRAKLKTAAPGAPAIDFQAA